MDQWHWLQEMLQFDDDFDFNSGRIPSADMHQWHWIPKVPIVDDYFDFNSLSYSVYRRYIELLSTHTNHYFRLTSKNNYFHCLDVRGIETQLKSGSGYGIRNKEDYLCKTGLLELYLLYIRSEWTKYLVVRKRFTLNYRYFDKKMLNFVKKYSELHVDTWDDGLIEQFIHPGLEIFKLLYVQTTLDQLTNHLKQLDVCPNLREFYFCIHWRINEATFTEMKKAIGQFYHRRQGRLTSCTVTWSEKRFEFNGSAWMYTGDYRS